MYIVDRWIDRDGDMVSNFIFLQVGFQQGHALLAESLFEQVSCAAPDTMASHFLKLWIKIISIFVIKTKFNLIMMKVKIWRKEGCYGVFNWMND